MLRVMLIDTVMEIVMLMTMVMDAYIHRYLCRDISGNCGIGSIDVNNDRNSDVDDNVGGCSDPSLFYEISYAGAAHKANGN